MQLQLTQTQMQQEEVLLTEPHLIDLFPYLILMAANYLCSLFHQHQHFPLMYPLLLHLVGDYPLCLYFQQYPHRWCQQQFPHHPSLHQFTDLVPTILEDCY